MLRRWCEALNQEYRGQRLAGLAHEIFLKLLKAKREVPGAAERHLLGAQWPQGAQGVGPRGLASLEFARRDAVKRPGLPKPVAQSVGFSTQQPTFGLAFLSGPYPTCLMRRVHATRLPVALLSPAFAPGPQPHSGGDPGEAGAGARGELGGKKLGRR